MTEWDLLRRVWAALGCAPNPEDYKPEVQQRMWDMAIQMIRESVSDDNRVYRENIALEAEVQRLRALVPEEQRHA